MICNQCGQEIQEDSTFCVHCGAKQEIEAPVSYVPKKKGRVGLVALLAAVVVCIVLTAVFIVLGGSDKRRIQEQLDLGVKYLEEMDYENAILAYETAIKIDAYSVDAYLGLAQVYIEIGEDEKAIEILSEAYEITKDNRIDNRLDGLKEYDIRKASANHEDDLKKEAKWLEELLTEEDALESRSAGETYLEEPKTTSDSLNEEEMSTEEKNIVVISDEYICDAIREASAFAWNWFWDSSREVVDENDTYTQMTEDGLYNWEYKCVTHEGIHCVQDVLELTKHYFTEDVARELMAQKQWYESDDKLYMSEPDGIGGYAPDYYDIIINQDSDTQYTIIVYEYFYGELMSRPYEVHYKYIDGHWVFDKVLVSCGVDIPMNVIEKNF